MIGAVQFLKKTKGTDQKFTAQITLFRKNECNMLSKAYFDHEIAFKGGHFECWKRSFFHRWLQNEVISGKSEKNAFKKADFEWKRAEKRKFSQCEYLSHCENKIEYLKRVQKKIVASLDFVGTKSSVKAYSIVIYSLQHIRTHFRFLGLPEMCCCRQRYSQMNAVLMWNSSCSAFSALNSRKKA